MTRARRITADDTPPSEPADLATTVLPWQKQDWWRATAAARHHGVLLLGRPGTGVETLAQALLSWRLCETRALDAPRNAEPSSSQAPAFACGHCPSCTWLAVRTHPDAALILPPHTLVARGWPMPPDWVKSGQKPSQEIGISPIRWLIDWFALTATRTRGKVALLYPAQSISRVAQNALLKLLEEPPEGALIVLAAERAADLLPTIRSRCTTVACATPDAAATREWLLTTDPKSAADKTPPKPLSAHEADSLARWSHGQPLLAPQAHTSLEWARLWLRAPAEAAQNETLMQASPAVMLSALERLGNDLLRLRWGAEPQFLAGEDAQRLATIRIQEQTLLAFQRDLPQRIRLSEHPINARLFSEATLLEFSQCLL